MMRKLVNVLMIGLPGFLIIALCAAVSMRLPFKNQPVRSQLDARPLTQYHNPTTQTFFDGSWMKEVGDFVDDRITGRIKLLEIHAAVTRQIFREEEVAGIWEDPNTEMLFTRPSTLPIPAEIDNALANLKAGTDASNTPLIFAYVPRKEEAFKDALPKYWVNTYAPGKEKILAKYEQYGTVLDLAPAVSRKDTRDSMWFLTDHHWKPAGAITAAGELREQLLAMGLTAPHPIPALDIKKQYPEFIGSIGRRLTRTGFTRADQFVIPWTSQSTEKRCTDKPIETKTCTLSAFEEKIGKSKDKYANRYATFHGGDNGIDDVRGNGVGTYIIVKDSFGDSAVPYFALGAKRVIAIDERHYVGKPISEIIKQIKPDAVIVMHNQVSLFGLTPEQLAVWK